MLSLLFVYTPSILWADSCVTWREIMPTIAQMKQQVDRIWYESFHTLLADTLLVQLRQHALGGVRAALETALVEEVRAYQQTCRQSRAGVVPPSAFHRAGTYTRRVLTSYGFIPALHVPKLDRKSTRLNSSHLV